MLAFIIKKVLIFRDTMCPKDQAINYLCFNHIIARNLALLHFVTNHGLILLYCNYCDFYPWMPP